MQGTDSQSGLHGRFGQHDGSVMRQAAVRCRKGVGGPRVVLAVTQPNIGAPVPEFGQKRAASVQHRVGHLDHVQHGHKRGAAGCRGDGRV